MSTKRNYIPIDNELIDFKHYLEDKDRCIFSARFGDGKSYFISEFIKKNKNKYLFIPIYPVNYQIADNKDILEYIKRDILIRLLASGEIGINDTTLSNSIYLFYYLQLNDICILPDLLSLAPDIHLNGSDISLSAFGLALKAFNKIKAKFEEYKSKLKNEEQISEDFINKYEKEKGSIYEFDIISQLICDIIEQYRIKHKNRRKVILLIEDLDRIDPAHIFRILNIFSAHFDRYTYGEIEYHKTQGLNKFKFDKVVTVCHYENIQSIYSHFYGANTDFKGYIAKFSIALPFKYSLKSTLLFFIKNNINKELQKFENVCDMLANMIYERYLGEENLLEESIRTLKSKLEEAPSVKCLNIRIQERFEINSVNEFTILLDLLRKFGFSYHNLVGRPGFKYDLNFTNLIGPNWLLALN